MTKVTKNAPNKNMGGSYVVENGKAKKIEGTVEPKVSAPRDKTGERLDRDPDHKDSKTEAHKGLRRQKTLKNSKKNISN